jgi:hypothetical protein
MSEERKQIIDQILGFSANTYSREYLDGPHPRTGKPYSLKELNEYLGELQQAASSPVPKIQKQVQQSPEVARIQAQQVWEYFFSHHLEIADNAANRKALFERGLSLSDDEMVRPAHLDEAAKLLIAEGIIKTKKVLTAAELKQRAVKDLETFKQCAIQLGFAANTANENLVRQVLGSGYSVGDIAHAIHSKALQLSSVGEVEQQQRDDKERRDLIGQILDDYAVDENLREAKRRQLERPDITLENLRNQVAVIRERARLHEMTPAQIREENAKRAAQQASSEKPINVAGELHGLHKQDYPTLPDVIWHEGREVPLDSVFLRRATTEQLKQLIKKYGDAQVVARLRQQRAVAVFGE